VTAAPPATAARRPRVEARKAFYGTALQACLDVVDDRLDVGIGRGRQRVPLELAEVACGDTDAPGVAVGAGGVGTGAMPMSMPARRSSASAHAPLVIIGVQPARHSPSANG